MRDKDTIMGGSNNYFPQTIWTEILSSAGDHKGRREQLEYLVSIYWRPVYFYIRRKWNKSNEETKDLTQDFFVNFMEKNLVESADPDKGMFRSYIKTLLKRFLINDDEKKSAAKRGGGYIFRGIDGVNDVYTEDSGKYNPEELFDRQWSKCVVEQSIRKLKGQLAASGKEVYFKAYKMYEIEKGYSYRQLADKLSISENDVINYLAYSRQLLRKIAKEEVAKYSLTGEDVDDEYKTVEGL